MWRGCDKSGVMTSGASIFPVPEGPGNSGVVPPWLTPERSDATKSPAVLLDANLFHDIHPQKDGWKLVGRRIEGGERG